MFTDVMPLEVVPSVKVSVAHSTQKAARLTMKRERLDAKVAHGAYGRLGVPLEGRRG